MSKWREKLKVHPAADVFPMMSDDELQKLGENIKENGLAESITLNKDGTLLLDGRNRLEAMERVGVTLQSWHMRQHGDGDPVAYIISKNIHRRHLTKAQQADLIVAALKAGTKPVQVEVVFKGGRGKVNPTKQAAIATGKELDISKATVERSLAKAEGNPKPEPAPKREPKLKDGDVRDLVAQALALVGRMGDEQRRRFEAAYKQTYGAVLTNDAEADDLGDIPACLDRRRR
jgi:hypothetical protein